MRDRRILGQCGWPWYFPLLGLAVIACSSSGGHAGTSGTGGATDMGGSTGSHDPVATAGVAGHGGVSGTGGLVETGGVGGNESSGAPDTGGTGAGAAGATGTGGKTGGGGQNASGTAGVTATGGQSRGGVSTTGSAAGTGGVAGGKTAGTTASGGGSGTGTVAKPSPGCNSTTAPVSGRATIDVSGTAREYILALPADYDASHPYRLIFAFHGGKYDAQSVADGGPPGSGPYYGIKAEAKDTAIFVAPQATTSGWGSSDVAYVKAMVTRFESQLCVDQNRIFATGFSMGAIMTLTLGCGSADIFRAIAPMSGSINTTCTGTQPIAYWSSHGTNDTTIGISSGQTARNTFMTRNHCSTQTQPGSPAGCVNYQGCDPGYPVVWCTFDGVHEPAPFAGSAIWAFFSQF